MRFFSPKTFVSIAPLTTSVNNKQPRPLSAFGRRLNPSGYQQIGSSVFGMPPNNIDDSNQTGSLFGSSVILSNDGMRLAIGAPGYSLAENSIGNGAVSLYDFVSTDWNFVTSFVGSPGEGLGSCMHLSGDGSRIIIRRFYPSTNSSGFDVYDSSSGLLVGSPLNCEGQGSTAELSQDGSRIAISCEPSDIVAGYVDTFEWNGTGWNKFGRISGRENGNIFASTISFSANGMRLAISYPLETTNITGNLQATTGLIEVLNYNTTSFSWEQIGTDLFGVGGDDRFGDILDFSESGSTIAITSSRTNSTVGRVDVYELRENTWISKGGSIWGELSGTLSLSNEGDFIALGLMPADDSTNRGQIKLLRYNGTSWEQFHELIEGVDNGDHLGAGSLGLSLSGDGNRIAFGSRFSSNEAGLEIGRARVLQTGIAQNNSITELQDGNIISSSPSNSPSSAMVAQNSPPTISASYSISPIPTTSSFNSIDPTYFPSFISASSNPTIFPSIYPTANPSVVSRQSVLPLSDNPSSLSEINLSDPPSASNHLTAIPSIHPSEVTSSKPSTYPTKYLDDAFSMTPSALVSTNLSSTPTKRQSTKPSVIPIEVESTNPSLLPTRYLSISVSPSEISTKEQLINPTMIPSRYWNVSANLSEVPTGFLSVNPSVIPTRNQDTNTNLSVLPTHMLSQKPSAIPSTYQGNIRNPSIIPTNAFIPTVTLDKFSWDIERIGATNVSFGSDSSRGEISLSYNISLRTATVQLLEEDCMSYIDQQIISVTYNTTIISSTHGRLDVVIDIKQANIVGSSIWQDGDNLNEGYINLCIRTDLILDDTNHTSVTFHEQRLFITVSLSQGFELSGIELERKIVSEDSEEADVDYGIQACQCNATFGCVETILSQGNDVQICVLTESPDIEISHIQELRFHQGARSIMIVADNTADDLSSIKFFGKMAVIRSQLRSFFFDSPQPESLIAEGNVIITFTNENDSSGTRRNLRVESNRFLTTKKGKKDDTEFEVEMQLTGMEERNAKQRQAFYCGISFLLTVILIYVLVFICGKGKHDTKYRHNER